MIFFLQEQKEQEKNDDKKWFNISIEIDDKVNIKRVIQMYKQMILAICWAQKKIVIDVCRYNVNQGCEALIINCQKIDLGVFLSVFSWLFQIQMTRLC